MRKTGCNTIRFGVLVWTASLCAIAWPAWADARPLRFSPTQLRSRGLPPQLAEYFAREQRFSPGHAPVSLVVNGVPKGVIRARFDTQGKLCVTRSLLERAGLNIPEELAERPVSSEPEADPATVERASEPCYDDLAAVPGASIRLLPNKARVEIIVPPRALRSTTGPAFSTGGIAAVLNYDIAASRSQYGSGSSRFVEVQTGAGLNASDWILRSTQSIIGGDQRATVSHGAAYAQRTWLEQGATLQVGQIFLANTVMGGAPLSGVQIVPESALSSAALEGGSVEGIAYSQQARVEVLQAGRRVYATVVPQGPFKLNNLQLVSDTADLRVIVTEADGARREFTVPSTSFMTDVPVAVEGPAFAFGRFGGTDRDFVGGAVTRGWAFGRSTSAAVTGFFAGQYQGAAGALTVVPATGPVFSARLHISHRTTDRTHGAQASLRVSGYVSRNLSASVSGGFRSQGFRHHMESEVVRRQCGSADLAIGLNYAVPSFGALSLGYGQSTRFGRGTRQYLTGSCSTRIGKASIALNARHHSGGARPSKVSTYLSVSMPFGRGGVSANVSVTDARKRVALRAGNALGRSTYYSASVQHSEPDGRTSGDLSLSHQGGYASLSGGLSIAPQALSYRTRLSGGLAFHGWGISFSPYPIQDTFGIVSTDGVPDVWINAHGGLVKTDHWGRAVIPSLEPYKPSVVQMSTRSLPRNADVDNGFKAVKAGRGSVQHLEFKVKTVRRLMLDVQTPDDIPLRRGALVLDQNGAPVATAISDRRVFLSDGPPDGTFKVQLNDGRYCKLSYTLPSARPPADQTYERLKASCTPLSPTP